MFGEMNSNDGVDLLFGIDVQTKRMCSYALLSRDYRLLESGWCDGDESEARQILEQFGARYSKRIAVGIDAPRMLLSQPRKFFPAKKGGAWRERKQNEKGHGRHCEIIISSLKIARPQWTPLENGPSCPKWMSAGFRLFEELKSYDCYEVFPSASYSLLEGAREPKILIDLSAFRPGPKDVLDACVCAVTVGEYLSGRGCEVGGGDGLGTIVLPRDIKHKIPKFMLTLPSVQNI